MFFRLVSASLGQKWTFLRQVFRKPVKVALKEGCPSWQNSLSVTSSEYYEHHLPPLITISTTGCDGLPVQTAARPLHFKFAGRVLPNMDYGANSSIIGIHCWKLEFQIYIDNQLVVFSKWSCYAQSSAQMLKPNFQIFQLNLHYPLYVRTLQWSWFYSLCSIKCMLLAFSNVVANLQNAFKSMQSWNVGPLQTADGLSRDLSKKSVHLHHQSRFWRTSKEICIAE